MTGEFIDSSVVFPLLAAKAHAYQKYCGVEVKRALLLKVGTKEVKYDMWELNSGDLEHLWQIFQQQFRLSELLNKVDNYSMTKKV
jgi:hypothetical protein